jgi:hypothetical protein
MKVDNPDSINLTFKRSLPDELLFVEQVCAVDRQIVSPSDQLTGIPMYDLDRSAPGKGWTESQSNVKDMHTFRPPR